MTFYNVSLSTGTSSADHRWAILAIDKPLLEKIVEAYLRGIHSIKHNGKTYKIASYYFQIYEIINEQKHSAEVLTEIYHELKKSRYKGFWDEKLFSETGKNVTADFLEGREWGDLKEDLYNVYLNSAGNKKGKPIIAVSREEISLFVDQWHNKEPIGWLGTGSIDLTSVTRIKVFDIHLKHRKENRGETKKYFNDDVRRFHRDGWSIYVLEQFGKEVTDIFKIGQYGMLNKEGKAGQLPRPEVIPKRERGKIFISHSSKDKAIVTEFTNEILILCLGAENAKIFCTSIEGLGITSGQDFRAHIKKELEEAQIVIQIISRDYKSSEACLNEMGAAWVLTENVIPLVIDGNYDVGFIHSTTHQLSISKKDGVLQFVDDWGHLFPNKARHSKINGHVDKFIKVINEKYSQTS